MKRPDRKYARFYYDQFAAEFPAIYADDAAFAAWMRLLALAEKMWPATPEFPRSLRPSALRKLTGAGLVIACGSHCYRIRGLDAERMRRSGLAKNAADVRWGADGNAERNADGTADDMPRRDENETSTPIPPPSGGSPRANGTNPRAIAAELTRQSNQAEVQRKARRKTRHLAYLDGRITEAQRVDMDDRDASLEELPSRRGAAFVAATS